ncbi:pyruvate formate lyase family protein [Paenibacillus puldeungensis]|uniref:Pyruvate formate lyase family protein n=1 Tax=Paenibacillus puldeungensis TaxID=696536 RepID=A0ABW3RS03_9BACL
MYEFSPVTDRIRRVHDRIRNRVIRSDAERALLITEAYKENELLQPIIKRPLATYKVCANMTCLVDSEDELFVGNRGKTFCGAGVNPEWASEGWIPGMIEQGLWELKDDGFYHNPEEEDLNIIMSPEDYEALLGIRDYWKTRRITASANAWQPEGYKEFARLGVSSYSPQFDVMGIATGHLTAGFPKIINVGYKSIRQQAQNWCDEHKGKLMGDDVDKYMFYQSAIIACDAAMIMIKRYSESATKEATACTNPVRKKELEFMADGLANIAENPARNFWEACQAALLYMLFLEIDSCYPAMAFGRFDQYTWPFLKKDLDAGALTMEQAQELVDSFFLKANCYYDLAHPFINMMVGLGNTYQHTTIGGCDPKTGEDATNPVTYMVLETLGRLQQHDPTISLRVTKDTPDKLWSCALETTKRVGGLPLFQNDEVIIKGLMENLGFSLEDARDYSLIGCQEIVGSGNDYPAPNGVVGGNASIHFGAIFAMAMNDGVNPFNGADCGIRCGKLSDMKSIEEVREAFRKISEYVFNWQITMNNYSEYMAQRYVTHAALSISMEGCMEKGKDAACGGCKYNSYGGTSPGLATCADSITAIKYLVFDKKICTAQELYDAVMKNWEGYEPLRQRVLNEAPHFGNADAYADEEMKWVIDLYTDLCSHVYSSRAKVYKPGLYGAADHVAQGYHTWATPDGRKTGEPIADAASPAQGRDKHGPSAIFISSCCYDNSKFMDGVALNIRIHPSALSREDGVEKLRDMTKAHFDNGGMEAQYNVVSTEELKAAQEKPEDYKNLVVRIAGYSAYFVEMNRDLQNDIISRTENMI